MSHPVVTEVARLAAQRSALENKLTDLRERLREREALVERAHELEADLRSVGQSEEHFRKQRSLPVLEDITIPTKCKADWGKMVGNSTERHCSKCDKVVYNLSAMTREEAEAFWRASAGKDTCVRLYRRPDGTIVHARCEQPRNRVAALALGAAALTGVAAIGVLSMTQGKAVGQIPGSIAAPVRPVPRGDDTERIRGGVPLHYVDSSEPPSAVRSHSAELEMGQAIASPESRAEMGKPAPPPPEDR